ncbi:sensor histidine kinase [Halpernia frigidisoli]|uniref:Signal transduction histidine kinase n=1 Tax=Halpernia frigidisoli TaxID=1125876 RepID=A0A1I3E5U2_9FLAO|nr:histidine kinase [Halpernia frigidisoli]SFH94248.1 Signal transduction histidine kinase [Halpernia frigidisoli]
MKKLIINLFFIFQFLFIQISYSQNYNLTNSFTTKDGLPSNLIYETLQDNSGFLWVATDNGISRFDGKRFINYSTKNGLPSNDVIQIIKQNDGTIWANCYKQAPSYFNAQLNRFVCLEYDAFVLEISSDLFSMIYKILKNELFFENYNGSFIFKEGKITNKKKFNKVDIENRITEIYLKNQKIVLKQDIKINGIDKNVTSQFYKENIYLGSIKIDYKNQLINSQVDNNSLYWFTKNKVYQTQIIDLKPFKYKSRNINISKNIKWHTFSEGKLNITCTDGTVLIYDEKTLQLCSTIKNKFNVNTSYVDHQNNVWVSTINNGLMYYTNQNIKKEQFSDRAITNFLCAKISDNGEIIAGNYQGEIYVKKGKSEQKYNFSQIKENNLWIRNIHFFPKKTIVVSDNGILTNFKKNSTFLNSRNERLNIKSSLKINESDLILGSIQGLIKYNVITEKYAILNFPKERILNLKKINDSCFYFSANEGLYEYHLNKDKYQLLISNKNFKNDKIEYFENISASKIWISTYKGHLFFLDHQKTVLKFINDRRLPLNISKLIHIGNQLWIASKSGIYVVNYDDLKSISVSKISTSDGLTSNVINYLDYKKDTVYAATDMGISKIPSKFIKTNFTVKPHLIDVKINGKNVALNSKYDLKSNENNISLELAGVDLTGHFKNFQYAVNSNNFTDINGNFLNLQLYSGLNKIIIRATNENNEVQKDQIVLVFDIATPFYKAIYFWIILTILISATIFYLVNRQKFLRQKRKFLQRLEIERDRNKITSDLHDDLGASLSSLQINSSIAQKLFDKNPLEAKKILKKIEFQAKNISENIGDIIWSLKPTKNEFMSLSTRIKKITSEILGSSDINYKIQIDEKINDEITDFSARKNIILIIKECLNNILKHSGATKMNLIIEKIDENFLIEISDNGIGFKDCENKGNGLTNIAKRTRELNAKLEILSCDGTSIKLEVPTFREV